MDGQMKQAQRPGPARAARRGAGTGAGGSTGGDAAALGPIAQRANAGPHAASLAGLQAVVAQRRCADCEHVRRAMGGAEPAQRSEKGGGLPDGLRAGLESLSGRDLSGVRVNYDSPKPAQLNAHAYAQGPEIHVAPGQEHHLPHEGWHAVQQMQNRVRPTMDLGGTPVNDSAQLEREADVMGARALSAARSGPVQRRAAGGAPRASAPGRGPVQRAVVIQPNHWFTDPRDIEYAARQAGATGEQARRLAALGMDGLTHRFASWQDAINQIDVDDVDDADEISSTMGEMGENDLSYMNDLPELEKVSDREDDSYDRKDDDYDDLPELEDVSDREDDSYDRKDEDVNRNDDDYEEDGSDHEEDGSDHEEDGSEHEEDGSDQEDGSDYEEESDDDEGFENEQGRNRLENLENQIRYWARRAGGPDSSGHGRGKKIKSGHSRDRHNRGEKRKVQHKGKKVGSLAGALEAFAEAGGTEADLSASTKKLLGKSGVSWRQYLG